MSFRRPARGLLPILLLLMAILATGAAAVRAYRTTRVHDELVHRVLAEYAEVASWSYRRHLEETLRSAGRELLGPVDHGAGLHLQPPVPHAGDLAHYIPYDAACLCHIPRDGPIPHDLLAFTLGADTIGVGVNRYTHTERGWLVDMVPGIPSPPQPAADFGDRYRWVLDTLSSHIRRGPDTRSGWLVRSADARPHLLAYQQMPTAWGDTIVYVAGYNANTLTALLTTVLDGEDLLPPALTRRFTNRDVLRLEVTTADGTVLLQTDTSDVWSLDSHVPIDAQYGALRVRTQIRPAVASALMIGGTPRSQLPLLLGLLALATALSIVAFRQLARESQLSRARSDFVASVSHELRTPLAQLRLFLETMRLGRADDEQSRSWSLDQMDRESRRLVHLVDNVLIFSRGPARLIDAPRERIDIATLTNEITAEYAPLAAARRASIATSGDAGDIVFAPRDALRHVLLNLLDNAVKYGPSGQTVHVKTKREGEFARIDVIDQGTGVPEGDRRRIFEPFQRGSNAAARAAGGTGIGLHLVRELVTGLDGTVNVTDAPGGGACFTVRLPVA